LFIKHVPKKNSNLYYTRLTPFWVSRVSGVQLRGFAPGPTHQGCSGGESLATGGRFDRLRTRSRRLTTAPSGRFKHVLPDLMISNFSFSNSLVKNMFESIKTP